jgi:hypothetical protein
VARSSIPAGQRFPDSRAAPRYPVIALAEVIEPLSKRPLMGSITIISATGCFFRAAESVAPGTVVRLKIERDGERFETWAQVAHVKPEDGMGLAFFDTPQPQKDCLLRWIAELAQAVHNIDAQ